MSSDSLPGTGHSWTVLTWNVHGSALPSVDALATAIRDESPDIVVLQEIRSRQATELATELQMRYSWAPKHYPYTKAMWWRAEGAAIMTPHLLDAVGHTEITDDQPMRSGDAVSPSGHWWVGRTVDGDVYNLHLSPDDDAESRRAEAARVSELMPSIGDDPPSVVAGDFNDADDAASSTRCPVSSTSRRR